MGKRVIHECDLTKQEINEEETLFTLKLAKKGTRSNMTYELSGDAAEKLLAQLNGRNELGEDWHFAGSSEVVAHVGTIDGRPRRRTLEDLERETVEDDTSFVAEKKASLREAGVIDDDEDEREEVSADSPISKAMGATAGCGHINKGRIQTTMRSGKRLIYRKCANCGKDIPEKTSEAKQKYMSAKAPKGVNMGDL